MKSIKPGRGPSGMGAVGSLFVAVFGVIWTIEAANMGAPFMFLLFGVGFVLFGLVQAFYNYSNATGKNRMSIVDIVEGNEEPDPLRRSPYDNMTADRCGEDNAVNFCPYCGKPLQQDFQYCPKCGQKIHTF